MNKKTGSQKSADDFPGLDGWQVFAHGAGSSMESDFDLLFDRIFAELDVFRRFEAVLA